MQTYPDVGCSGDRYDVIALRKEPGECDLSWSCPMFLADVGKRFDRRLDIRQVLFLEPREGNDLSYITIV